MESQDTGVSVVIPCHNARYRLEQTLAHISSQVVPVDLAWEVIVVDNASTDGTGEAVQSFWSPRHPVPMRVVREERLGMAYARLRCFREARYDIVCFVEDDNWVGPEYLSTALDILRNHPQVGACGGQSEAVCEVSPPDWFATHSHHYAVGKQGDVVGDITWSRGWLWGAGLTVRKSAWQRLQETGFTPSLEDRKGTQLSTGGDVELCLALRLLGWRLWYDPRLQLAHFMQKHRLNWPYLRRLNRWKGVALACHDSYRFAASAKENPITGKFRRNWYCRLVVSFVRLLILSPKLGRYFGSHEGDGDVLSIERELGRVQGLWSSRSSYAQTRDRIQNQFPPHLRT
jgi:glycosyltransferase involved in cell wall biosynthesis